MNITGNDLNLKNLQFFKFRFIKLNHLAKQSLELDDRFIYKFFSSFTYSILIAFILAITSYTCHANDMCSTLDLGWHFYCDSVEKQINKPTAPTTIEEAKAELTQIQKKLEDLKVLAVMNPSNENIINYIKYQREQLERASAFSEAWQKVVWQNPDIDYMVKTPISSVGNELREEIKYKNLKHKLSQINKRYGIFFFYKGSYEYCVKFSPILKTFSEVYSIEVIAISMDGMILPEWPGSQINRGQAEKFE